MEKKYFTVKEAGEYLGVSALTLRNWDRNGKFLASRHPISNYRLYRVVDLEKLMKEIEEGDIHRIKLSRPLRAKTKKIKVQFLED